ncbi:hypothetical protein DEM27_00140 [Metarhizobium album]|uniref:Phage gp6-like head-tail connector protein n=1 Tax=Metarhizobium album TaxID=2182425 RepID=A0A2U2DWF8_9HYPH|nr:hypothetical protein [Rhizobium album]PWE57658.1 hypothetical protein DEM27_00140 [Rhizobium album]
MSNTSFVVVTAAPETTLLTAEERRAAAGLGSADASRDADLEALDERVAAAIATECNIAAADEGEDPPTLRRERLRQTIDLDHKEGVVVLSRRHAISIVSVSQSGAVIGPDNFRVNSGAGLLSHRSGVWSGTVVVEYWAGFTDVPDDLKQVAIETMRSYWIEMTRDPTVKAHSIEVDGVETIRTDFWAGALPGKASGSSLPASVLGSLARYRNGIYA